MDMVTMKRFAPWPLSGFNAFVFLWYLQYKFTGHEGSVDLFTTLTDWLGFHGYERIMRIGTGSAELFASLLLFLPRFQALGALLSFGIMAGAIFFHVVSPLGIDPYNDGGILFMQACGVLVSSFVIIVLRLRDLNPTLVSQSLGFLFSYPSR